MKRTMTGVAAGLCALALAAGSPPAAAALPAQTAPVSTAAVKCSTSRPMQYVVANIKSGMADPHFTNDLNQVYRDGPDFVTLNEVPQRTDAKLLRTGYELWRTPGQYTGANPVIWRTDRWSPIARGTTYISNQPGKTASQKVEWGIRYANWVTLRSTDGCQTISVVSFHVAPEGTPYTEGLTAPSAQRLAMLADYLKAYGPVLMGGDMNTHQKSKKYPRATFDAVGVASIWDITGTILPTGKHGGNTIDYILMSHVNQFTGTKVETRNGNSDHRAVVGNLVLDPNGAGPRGAERFIQGRIVNVPNSKLATAQGTVRRTVLQAIKGAPTGSSIRITTSHVTDKPTRVALARAHRRGVVVRVITTGGTSTGQERILTRALKKRTKKTAKQGSYLRLRKPVKAIKLPPTMVLISQSGTTAPLRIDVDRALQTAALRKSLARADVYTASSDYAAGSRMFTRLAKRKH